MHKRALVWIRRDLRWEDHRAWAEAEALSSEIAVLFVFDKCILEKLSENDRRLTFINDSLEQIRQKLKSKNSDLLVAYGDPKAEVPRIVQALGADALFVNRDYEPYAKRRDTAVKNSVETSGIAFYSFKDHVIFESDEIKNKSGGHFKVFTPYAKAWLNNLEKENLEEAKVKLKNLIPAAEVKKLSVPLDLGKFGFKRQKLFLPSGPEGAKTLLKKFKSRIKRYDKRRNFPARNESSQLSTHLRFGTISVRQLMRETAGKDVGTRTWHKELIWRDFYQMLLAAYPQLPEKCFQKQCDAIEWPGTRENFQAWCEGRTGYPLVDATMRHFAKTGWVHNRLRMVVASFLTKDLLCHWKWGEEFFAQHLMDFDLASNNGGWQWAASVGCDAQPYFRIFNPVLQSEKYDPDANFILQEIPELAVLPKKYVHAPWTSPMGVPKTYTKPIVEHAAQKVKAIKLFRDLKK